MLKHWRYAWYVVRHKWFVFQAGRRLGVGLWQLLWHDWTKLLPGEWHPYVEYFYGGHVHKSLNFRESLQADFDEAWNRHQKGNRHHWQYWVLLRDDGSVQPLDMPKADILEMLADWIGAGRAITGRNEVKAWYLRNRDTMQLHPETRGYVEWLLLWHKGAR